MIVLNVVLFPMEMALRFPTIIARKTKVVRFFLDSILTGSAFLYEQVTITVNNNCIQTGNRVFFLETIEMH